MSTPILDLDCHEGGAQASIRFEEMSSGERWQFLGVAVTALFTGKGGLKTAHARTLHRGHCTQLSFDDRPVTGSSQRCAD
ncbi:MAG: hypothetical protein WC809_10195 [Sinimarinibacterium sp.]|jgi:hypothetical protein